MNKVALIALENLIEDIKNGNVTVTGYNKICQPEYVAIVGEHDPVIDHPIPYEFNITYVVP